MERRSNYRWTVALFALSMTFVAFMDRVNLSVATPAIMTEFGFSKMDMGMMQTAFFLGYSLFQVPGGMLAEYFGHRVVNSGAVIWWSVFTSLTAACGSFTSWIGVRFLFGIGEAPVFPALNAALAKWFPKTERGKAVSMMAAGSMIGPVFGPAIVVALMTVWGWRTVFVVFGVAGATLAILYYLFVTVFPKQSKYVNSAELDYINAGMEVAAAEKEIAPWKNFITSSQFWAIGLQFFFTDYVFYVFLAWLPLYLLEAQKFSLQQMGMAAAFPYILMASLTLLTGYVGDGMVKKGIPKWKARSVLATIGLMVCCVGLYFASTSTEKWTTVFWITLALGFLGPTFSASWASCADVGGRFVGTVTGWMNFWGNMGGVAAPVMTAWIATKYGWQAAIVVTSVAAILGAVCWALVKPDSIIEKRA